MTGSRCGVIKKNTVYCTWFKQWLKDDILAYLDEWEASIAAVSNLTKSEKSQRCLSPAHYWVFACQVHWCLVKHTTSHALIITQHIRTCTHSEILHWSKYVFSTMSGVRYLMSFVKIPPWGFLWQAVNERRLQWQPNCSIILIWYCLIANPNISSTWSKEWELQQPLPSIPPPFQKLIVYLCIILCTI